MKKKWGIIDYLVIATIIIILLATSWTEKGKWILFICIDHFIDINIFDK